MARIRTIKPDFFKNEEIAEMPAMTRLLFIGLWTQADREGRLLDRPKRLKAEIFPYDNYDVNKGLDELHTKKFIIRYKADVNAKGSVSAPEQSEEQTDIIQITNFLKHQVPHYKEVPSQLPSISSIYDGPVKVQPLTEKERQAIFQRDGHACKECGDTNDLTIDHIVPITKGGTKEPENLQVLCRKCNSSKNNRINIEPMLGQRCTQEGKGKEQERKGECHAPIISERDSLPDAAKDPPEIKSPPVPPAPPRQNKGPCIEAVLEFFSRAGGTDEMAHAFWNKYESLGWMQGISPIVNWLPKANGFIASWHQIEENNKKNGAGEKKNKQIKQPTGTIIQGSKEFGSL